MNRRGTCRDCGAGTTYPGVTRCRVCSERCRVLEQDSRLRDWKVLAFPCGTGGVAVSVSDTLRVLTRRQRSGEVQ